MPAKPMEKFWRRREPMPEYDIALLRPPTLEKGRRFETLADARQESLRSENLLRGFNAGNADAEYLRDCRDGHFYCDKPYCPGCARTFRRWFTAELLRVGDHSDCQAHIITVLLAPAPRGKIDRLDPHKCRDFLRKRLSRSGLANVPVIGGFEMVYKASLKSWILHVNLVVVGGSEKAIKQFEHGFADSELDRAALMSRLKDCAQQLSYALKFTTYHRPHKQRGATKGDAKPLNAAQHHELVQWMSAFSFQDFMFFHNARRVGEHIMIRADAKAESAEGVRQSKAASGHPLPQVPSKREPRYRWGP